MLCSDSPHSEVSGGGGDDGAVLAATEERSKGGGEDERGLADIVMTQETRC